MQTATTTRRTKALDNCRNFGISSQTLYRTFIPICLCLALGACSSAYYGAMERLGYAKRDLMVSRVKAAQSTQEETKEQFSSALERYKSVVSFNGGSLEEKYEALKAAYERSEKKAKELSSKVDSVEDVAEALFDEWENELGEYSNSSLRSQSEGRLRDTQRKYKPMIKAMRQAEKSVSPVLAALRDQVLYLKHNLNAKAIGALQGEVRDVEQDVASLLQSMERSMQESKRFIAELEAES